MPERDSQTVVLSRQSILLVTAVSVGLLTLCYVLGVQVGKQSAALRHPLAKDSGEDLQELPAPILDQLKNLENVDLEKVQKANQEAEAPRAAAPSTPKVAPPVAAPAKAEAKGTPKKESPAVPAKKAPEAAKGEPRWTLQLVATPDVSEAERVAAKAKAAGFATTTLKDKGAYKVRLAKSAPRAEIDAAAAKLKGKGLATFPVKSE